MFEKKKTEEELEKEEIFKDVLKVGQDNSKKIKKYQKKLDRKFFRFLVASLLFLSFLILAYDMRMAIITDVWNPLNINDVLVMLNLREINASNALVQYFLAAPLFMLVGAMGLLIFVLF